MKNIAIGLILSLGFMKAHAGEPVIAGMPGLPAAVTAIEVQFGDFGAGHSHRPQAAAMALVAEAVKSMTVGKYVLRSIQHHGEISFCIEATKNIFGAQGDLSEMLAQLDELQPDRGDMYSLSLKTVSACN